jgi:predicted RNase H-like nuclease (RuvC/YqgF family)
MPSARRWREKTAMTDIVERLRDEDHGASWRLQLEAAAEIERRRADIAHLDTKLDDALDEIERLRGALMALQDAYRDVEMAMPTEQGKAATLAWMKAARALKEKADD